MLPAFVILLGFCCFQIAASSRNLLPCAFSNAIQLRCFIKKIFLKRNSEKEKYDGPKSPL